MTPGSSAAGKVETMTGHDFREAIRKLLPQAEADCGTL
jgi:hypothetical protein